jgi:cell division protein FtsB
MKLLVGILALLLAGVQTHLWWGKGSVQELHDLQFLVQQQRAQNLALKQRNASLSAEVADLKLGVEALEEHARVELGMIKHGEIFYQLLE